MKNLLLFLLLLAAVGCKTVQPPNFTPTEVGFATEKADADLRSIAVSYAQPAEQTGKVRVAYIERFLGTSLTPVWKEALNDALVRSAIFSDNSTKKVSLLVKITEFDPPSAGITFETPISAKYEIIDRENGAVVFTTQIQTLGKCEMSHDFVGAVRSVEAMNRGVQQNIIEFIQQLEGAELNKELIPGRE